MSENNSNVPSEEQIRQRAYEIYAESGYVDGRDEENWLRAEEEVKNQVHQPDGESMAIDEPGLQSGGSQANRGERRGHAAGGHY